MPTIQEVVAGCGPESQSASSGAAAPALQLPSDRPYTGKQDYTEHQVGVSFAANFGSDGAVGESWQAVVAATYVTLLYRYSGQLRIPIRFHSNGERSRSGLLTFELAPDDKVRFVCRKAGDKIENLVVSAGSLSMPAVAALTLDEQDAPPNSTRPFPSSIHLMLKRDGNWLGGAILYNAELYEPDTIARLSGHFETLLQASLRNPDCLLRLLPLLTSSETEQLERDWTSGETLDDFELPVRRFERVAATRPDAIAAEFAGSELRYAELERRANRLAQFLVSIGVVRETAVAVCVAPSYDILIAMLAIWKAGGTYVPLDPTHPKARLEAILEDTKPLLLLTHGKLKENQLIPEWRHELLDEESSSWDAFPDVPPHVELLPEQTAYVFYTSGTTGKPKGVAASHANLNFYTKAARERYGFSASDTFCSIARYTFSISMFELVSPLLCGGRLVLLERAHVLEPANLVTALQRVSVLHAGPSLLKFLFRHLGTAPVEQRTFPGMRHASSGGDLVPPELLEDMKSTFPNAELFVIYGCTEISCMGCTFAVPRSPVLQKSYVGKPFPDVSLLLVDDAGQRVPIGVIGAVHFAGRGVTKGYLNRPELDAEKFQMLEGRRYYSTGDLARYSPSGELEILGREDYQVQLHGIRIELGEIEYALRQAPRVREAVVTAREGEDGEKALVAYVVGEQLEEASQELRRFLLNRLPDYMVPTAFVVLPALPLNHNFKVDRRALPEPAQSRANRTGSTTASVSARSNDVEERVARVFARFLGLDHVGIDDDFFDLGGYSLLALRVTGELGNLFGLSFPIGLLFQCPTVRMVAHQIRTEETLEPRPVMLNRSNGAPTVFMLAAVHIYRNLARALEPHFAALGVTVDREARMAEDGVLSVPLVELAAEYVTLVQRAQPVGPYRLAGFSFGGILAYEVAQQLRRAGFEVEHLWLIDAVLPARGPERRQLLERFLALNAKQQARTVVREVRNAIRRLYDNREQQFQPQNYADDRVLAMDQLRTRAYLDAATAYAKQMRRYDGAATLVVANRRLAGDYLLDPRCGWDEYVEKLDVTSVDAHHLEMLSDAPVRDVAMTFLATLDHQG